MEVETSRSSKSKTSPSAEGIPLPTEAELSGQRTKNIKMKQYLCVKHALPKTRLTHAILHENVSQDRHLEMTMSQINHTKNKASNVYDLSRRAFVAQQERKMKKWKKEDDNRIAGMNLPNINHMDVQSPPATVVIYHMPEDAPRPDVCGGGGGGGGKRDQSLPMMHVRRERTEIVCHQDKTFVTRFPSVVEVNQRMLERHNTYCGKSLLSQGAPRLDERFRELHTTLRPAMLKESDSYPLENMITKSRRAKYANIFPLNSDPGYRCSPDVRIVVASGRRSLASSRFSDRSFGRGVVKFACSVIRKKNSSSSTFGVRKDSLKRSNSSVSGGSKTSVNEDVNDLAEATN